MFNHAAKALGADWVLLLDADEFIDDRAIEGGLLDEFERLARDEPDTRCLRMELMEYRCAPDLDDPHDPIAPSRIKRRREPFGITKVFLHTALADPDLTVGGGNHFAMRDGKVVESRSEPRLKLAHYPERAGFQLLAKWVKGWAKVLAAETDLAAKGASNHYSEPFKILRDEPWHLLRNPGFMALQQNHPLFDDPIVYRGGALRFTPTIDPAMHATRALIGYIEELASQHGRLVSEIPEARAKVEAWNKEVTTILE